MANLVLFKGVCRSDAAIPLDDRIMGGFLRHQIQRFLNGFTRSPGGQRFLCSLQLNGIHSGGDLNERHGQPPVGQRTRFVRQSQDAN